MVNASPLPPPSPAALAGAGGLALAASRFATAGAGAQVEPELLFAHGFGQTRGAWHRTAQVLAAEGRAGLAYDARGHGDSARNPADLPYAGDQFADDLIIIAGEQARPPVLVGASMGGLFGLIAEARWPGLFSAMVLVDITPRWEEAGLQRILGFISAFPHGFDSLEHAAEVVAAYLPHRRTRKAAEDMGEVLRQGADGRWRWHWDARLVDELVRDCAQHQDAIAEAARTIRCPVLLVSGGRSDLVSTRTIEEFQLLVPHARHARLPQATHMLAGDDNDGFTASVREYLAELSATPASINLSHGTAAKTITGVSP